MTKLSILCLFALILLGCKSPNSSDHQDKLEKHVTKEIIKVDTSNIAVLPVPKTKSFTCPLLHEKNTTLSEQELQEAEEVLQSCFETNQKALDSNIIKLYKRQYVPYLNDKGEKLIWISCFCNDNNYFPDWKTAIAETNFVMDGGDCYLTVTINLTKKSFDGFGTHGYA